MGIKSCVTIIRLSASTLNSGNAWNLVALACLIILLSLMDRQSCHLLTDTFLQGKKQRNIIKALSLHKHKLLHHSIRV